MQARAIFHLLKGSNNKGAARRAKVRPITNPGARGATVKTTTPAFFHATVDIVAKATVFIKSYDYKTRQILARARVWKYN